MSKETTGTINLRQHNIFKELTSLGIVDPEAVVSFYPHVRDRNDVGVLRCAKSGVIFLDRVDHVATSYYEEKEGTSYWSSEDRNAGLKETREDDSRRAEQIKTLVTGKRYVDVGSGMGGILDLVKPWAKEIHAVEPQKDIRNTLERLGYNVHSSIASLANQSTKFDLVTLFHVFEHLTEPLQSLKYLNEVTAPGGKIFIEVPHAGDALINAFDLDAFKKFTFWSEHLVLHTRKSLATLLEAAGFKNVAVQGFQRYPLANHLLWLKEGLPGGQNKFPQFRNPALEKAYADTLNDIDQTDTIIAIAEKA